MKKLCKFVPFLMPLATTLFLACCSSERHPVSGFIVCKEYNPGHMCHDTEHIVQQASLLPIIMVPHVATTHHTHHYVESTWILFVANRDGVREVAVDQARYAELHVGQRFTYYSL